MNRTRVMAWVGSLAFAVLLGGCGGSNSSSATVGGTVHNLQAGTSVTLELNGNSNSAITMSADGSFTFSGNLASTAGYKVTVSSPPTAQTCVVNYGSGTIDYGGNSVTDVAVNCTANVSIQVAVSGLTNNTSSNNVTFNLAVQYPPQLQTSTLPTSFSVPASANGVTYPFPTSATDSTPVLLPLGTVYTVTVAYQPTLPVQVCTLDPKSTAPYTGGVVSSTAAIVVSFKCK